MLQSIDSATLKAMTDAQLIELADVHLGIVIPHDVPRTQILTKIVNAAYASRTG